jgi:hypothetical protein
MRCNAPGKWLSARKSATEAWGCFRALGSAIDNRPLCRCRADFSYEPSAKFQQATQIVRIDSGTGPPTAKHLKQILDLSGTLADRDEIEGSSGTVNSVREYSQLQEARRIALLDAREQLEEEREFVSCTFQEAFPDRRQFPQQSGLLVGVIHVRVLR